MGNIKQVQLINGEDRRNIYSMENLDRKDYHSVSIHIHSQLLS